MLLIEYANKHKKSPNYLTLLAKKDLLPSVKKKQIERVEASRNGKYCIKKRPMWIVEDEQAVTKALEKISANRHIKSLIFRDRWTKASIECYKVRLMCHKCSNFEICRHIKTALHLPRPPIKDITIRLFKEYGRPPERINEE